MTSTRRAFFVKPYDFSFFNRVFPCGCEVASSRLMSISVSLIARPFDVILSWTFKGNIQMSSDKITQASFGQAPPRRTTKLYHASHAGYLTAEPELWYTILPSPRRYVQNRNISLKMTNLTLKERYLTTPETRFRLHQTKTSGLDKLNSK